MTTSTRSKTPVTQVDPDAEHKRTRAGLQQKLKDRDKIKAALDEATTAINEANRLVTGFERPLGYADKFELDYSHKARAYNDLFNAIPQELQNSCEDAQLRGEFSDARSLKRDGIREQGAAKSASEQAVQSLTELRSKLTRGDSSWPHPFGSPAHLSEGEELPWSSSAIGRFLGTVATTISKPSAEPVLWTVQGDVIAFRPGAIGATDIERDFVRGWAEQSRAVRQTAKALSAADERLKSASEALEVIRQKLIWSPV